MGAATAVNNPGDIVGYSSNGTFRYPVYFRNPGDVVDLTSTGLFDPVDINDQRVVVDQSSTVKRLDLDTMIAQDLGVPPPSGTVHYRATRSAAINESNQVAGSAILATSTSCDRTAARYTDAPGWQVFTGCGQNNIASDINELGDVVMLVTITPYVRLEGVGTFVIENLIDNDVGHWYAVTTTSGWINNQRQIVIYAHNDETGETGALLLTPEGVSSIAMPADPEAVVTGLGAITVHPNPCQHGAVLSYRVPTHGEFDLSIYDAAGRRVRQLLSQRSHEAGSHELWWDGRDDRGGDTGSGVYFSVLRGKGETTTARFVVAR